MSTKSKEAPITINFDDPKPCIHNGQALDDLFVYLEDKPESDNCDWYVVLFHGLYLGRVHPYKKTYLVHSVHGVCKFAHSLTAATNILLYINKMKRSTLVSDAIVELENKRFAEEVLKGKAKSRGKALKALAKACRKAASTEKDVD